MLGMTLMTTAMSLPMIYAGKRFFRFSHWLVTLSGAASVAFGAFLVYQIGFVNGLFTSNVHWNSIRSTTAFRRLNALNASKWRRRERLAVHRSVMMAKGSINRNSSAGVAKVLVAGLTVAKLLRSGVDARLVGRRR